MPQLTIKQIEAFQRLRLVKPGLIADYIKPNVESFRKLLHNLNDSYSYKQIAKMAKVTTIQKWMKELNIPQGDHERKVAISKLSKYKHLRQKSTTKRHLSDDEIISACITETSMEAIAKKAGIQRKSLTRHIQRIKKNNPSSFNKYCVTCGKNFTPTYPVKQRFCSHRCKTNYQYIKKHPHIALGTKPCKKCQKLFLFNNTRRDFCSLNCVQKKEGRIDYKMWKRYGWTEEVYGKTNLSTTQEIT